MVIITTKATTIAVFLERTCQKTAVNKKMVGMAGPYMIFDVFPIEKWGYFPGMAKIQKGIHDSEFLF